MQWKSANDLCITGEGSPQLRPTKKLQRLNLFQSTYIPFQTHLTFTFILKLLYQVAKKIIVFTAYFDLLWTKLIVYTFQHFLTTFFYS